MKFGSLRGFLALAAVLACGLFLVTPASATVTGLLRTDSGAGGVTVGATFIDWTPPVGGPNGSFLVAAGTTLTSAGGSPPVGSSGSILDLTLATPFPIIGFMTFAAIPTLVFDLTSIGPGSPNTNCATVVAIGQSCSVFVGSPFVLTLQATGTTVALAVAGVARDGTVPTSSWIGQFTTQIQTLPTVPPGGIVTPLDIQNYFFSSPDATVSSSHSGEFIVTVTSQVPEPETFYLTLLGGLFLAGSVVLRKFR